MKKWKCTVCGYIHEGEEPPDECPVCGADKSLFELVEGEKEDSPAQPAKPAASPSPKTGVTKWKCTVCGYIHEGAEPPEECPVCGADKSAFVPLDDEEEKEEKKAETPPPQDDAIDNDYKEAVQSKPSGKSPAETHKEDSGKEAFERVGKVLTKLHGHPIAVHIPNGLLPVAVLFTLLAVIFGSSAFAVAARYNIGFVALAMPIVIATGYIDWQNRFNGKMTSVFRIKIICAAIVTTLSVILAIWWIVNPDIYNSGLAVNGFFLLLNVVNLVAAAVAGWYGGKLVFR